MRTKHSRVLRLHTRSRNKTKIALPISETPERQEGPANHMAGPTGSRCPRANRYRSRLSDQTDSNALPAETGSDS